jgi:hypothetical protein
MQQYILDPTVNDEASKVRGIGRYISTIIESLPKIIRVDTLSLIKKQSLLLLPFFNLESKPIFLFKPAHKIIVVIHDLIPLKYKDHYPVGKKATFFRVINMFLLRFVDRIITDSYVSRMDIHKYLHIPLRSITVVYPALASTFFSQHILKQPSIDTEYILYVGDATWNKNITTILKAAEIANIPCVFVGKVFEQVNIYIQRERKVQDSMFTHPWQKELKLFANLALNNPFYKAPGFIDDMQLLSLYKYALCNVLISRDEGFGYSYSEASALGTPSLLSNEPIFHETAAEAALFAQTENPQDVAVKILTYKNKPVLRARIALEAKNRSIRFSSVEYKKNMEKLIEGLS